MEWGYAYAKPVRAYVPTLPPGSTVKDTQFVYLWSQTIFSVLNYQICLVVCGDWHAGQTRQTSLVTYMEDDVGVSGVELAIDLLLHGNNLQFLGRAGRGWSKGGGAG